MLVTIRVIRPSLLDLPFYSYCVAAYGSAGRMIMSIQITSDDDYDDDDDEAANVQPNNARSPQSV